MKDRKLKTNTLVSHVTRILKERGHYQKAKVDGYMRRLTSYFKQYADFKTAHMPDFYDYNHELHHLLLNKVLTIDVRDDMAEILAKFLRKRGIMESFEANLPQNDAPYTTLNRFTLVKSIKEYVHIREIHPFLYITHAFIWSGTREGDYYWRQLNIQWMKLLNRYLNI